MRNLKISQLNFQRKKNIDTFFEEKSLQNKYTTNKNLRKNTINYANEEISKVIM